MRLRWHVEEVTGLHLGDATVCEGGGRTAGYDHADMLDGTVGFTDARTDIDRPLPAGPIGSAVGK